MKDGVDIDRAHAAPGTSRALADIAHDFERTLLKLRVHLDELLQAVADISSAASGVPSAKIARMLKPAQTPRAPAKAYPFRGQRLSIRQLAELAGCSYLTMHSRLKHNDAETAVSMGKADAVANWKGGTGGQPATDVSQGKRVFFKFEGRQCSVQELANRAGCTYAAMHARLRNHTPAEAVAMGVNGPPGVKRSSLALPAPTPTPAQPPRPSVFEHRTPAAPPPIQTATRVAPRLDEFRQEVLAPGSKLDQLKRGELKASDVEPVIPPDVKRTVAPPMPDRHAVTSSAERPFSSRRIGEYDDDRTHIATVYGAKAS